MNENHKIEIYELEELPTKEFLGKQYISVNSGRGSVLVPWDEDHVYRELWLHWFEESNIFDK